MSCPDVETLISALASGSGELDGSVAAHVAICPECRESVRLIHETVLGSRWANPESRYGKPSDVVQACASWGVSDEVPEMVLYLGGVIGVGGRRYVSWTDSVEQTDVRRAEAYAATRSLGGSSQKPVPNKMSFVKRERDCSLKIEVEVAPQGATVSLRLLTPTEAPMLPFSLSVRDVETGELLLDGREFKTGACILRGIERGHYTVKASSRNCECRFSFEVA